MPPLRYKRALATATVVAGEILVCGGTGELKGRIMKSLKSAERYDCALGKWIPLPRPRRTKQSAAAASF